VKRNNTTLFLESPGATTPISWVDDAPDFSGFSEPTLGVLQSSWQAFLGSGEEIEIIPDPPPPIPEPDWTAFNLAMIPPQGESDFEFWLDQFKILYQSSLATAAASGNAVETQRIYDLLKLQYPPTTEQVSAWQALADLHHVPLTF
jgi:hypothetical protein